MGCCSLWEGSAGSTIQARRPPKKRSRQSQAVSSGQKYFGGTWHRKLEEQDGFGDSGFQDVVPRALQPRILDRAGAEVLLSCTSFRVKLECRSCMGFAVPPSTFTSELPIPSVLPIHSHGLNPKP